MDLSKFSDEQLLIASKIIEEAQKAGLDPNLALAVASSESGFNPEAKSEKNAIGVMQLLPSTAKSLNVDPHDVDENIRGGIQYLKQNLDRFGDVNKALAAYNSGPGSKFFQTGDIKDLPDETLEYISRINSIYEPTPSKEKGAEEKGEKTEGKKTEKPEEDNSLDRAIAGGAGAVTGFTLGKAFPDKGLVPQSMAGLERKQIG
ncbi:lytic transglycosylase domain-containing protein, partial [bacterium]|nr:lytic transglycosylase domain-containing protein [bacterium]